MIMVFLQKIAYKLNVLVCLQGWMKNTY